MGRYVFTPEKAREAALKAAAARRARAAAAPAPSSSSSSASSSSSTTSSNVIPLRPAPAWNAAIEVLRPSAPAAVPLQAGPAQAPPAPAPTTELAPPEPPPRSDPANQMFSEMAGEVVTGLGIVAITKLIEKEGLDPDPPTDDEIESCEEQTSLAIARGLGDAELPWYMPFLIAWGRVYAGMRMSATSKKREAEKAAPAAATTTTTPPPAGPPPAGPPIKPFPPPRPSQSANGSIPWEPLPLVAKR